MHGRQRRSDKKIGVKPLHEWSKPGATQKKSSAFLRVVIPEIQVTRNGRIYGRPPKIQGPKNFEKRIYNVLSLSSMLSSPVLFGAIALSLASPAVAFHGAALPSALRLRTSVSNIAAPARPLRSMGGFAGARMLSDDVAHAAPRMLPAVRSAGLTPMKASSSSDGIVSKILKIDFQLLIFFALWYLGNYYYNITNKLALKAAGGLIFLIYHSISYFDLFSCVSCLFLSMRIAFFPGAAGFPLTIATLQLGVGVIYALFLWAAPDARRFPKVLSPISGRQNGERAVTNTQERFSFECGRALRSPRAIAATSPRASAA